MNWQPVWTGLFGQAPGSADIEAMNEFARLCHPHLDDPLFIITMFLQRQCGILTVSSSEIAFRASDVESISTELERQSNGMAAAGEALVVAANTVNAQAERVARIMAALTDEVLQKQSAAAAAPRAPEIARPQAVADGGRWKSALPLLNACAWVVALTVITVLITGRSQVVTREEAAAILAPDNAGSLLIATSNGDLRMLLNCDHPTWTYRLGYCRPNPGVHEIQGWAAFRSENRAADQK